MVFRIEEIFLTFEVTKIGKLYNMAKQEKQAKKQGKGAIKTDKSGSRKTAGSSGNRKDAGLDFPLGKENFILMAIGFAIIILGYILMSGDENIYDFRKTTLSVIVVMFGYAFEIYAIMKTPESQKKEEEEKEN